MTIYDTALNAAVASYGDGGTDANILKRAERFAEWLDEKTAQDTPDFTGGTVIQEGVEDRKVESFDGTFYHLEGVGSGSRTLIHRSVIRDLAIIPQDTAQVSEFEEGKAVALALEGARRETAFTTLINASHDSRVSKRSAERLRELALSQN